MPLTMAPIIIGTSSTSTKMIIAVPVIIVIASSSTCWMIIVTPIIGVTAWPVKKLRTDLEGGFHWTLSADNAKVTRWPSISGSSRTS